MLESHAALARHFDDELLAKIPLARTMQLRVSRYDGDLLALAAPLAPNVNDKGCAFGGSLASALTLAGWGLVALKLESIGSACDIYVQDSTIRYFAPIRTDFEAQAVLADGPAWEPFLATLAARGKARIDVRCRVALADDSDATTLGARFVAIRRASES
ncbi:MAG TPA: YiiD C-terminal domain-containing protein [Rudaea sp.]